MLESRNIDTGLPDGKLDARAYSDMSWTPVAFPLYIYITIHL